MKLLKFVVTSTVALFKVVSAAMPEDMSFEITTTEGGSLVIEAFVPEDMWFGFTFGTSMYGTDMIGFYAPKDDPQVATNLYANYNGAPDFDTTNTGFESEAEA